MKTRIILTIFTLLSSILTPSYLIANEKQDIQYSVEKGVIDLSYYNLELIAPVNLDGMWEFRWDELLEPGDSKWDNSQDETQYYPVPIFWTSYIDQNYSSVGQGTYRLIIKTSGECRYYGIKLPEIFSEYRLWINDDLIDERWNFDGDQSHYLKPSIFSMYSESDVLEIVLQVRNSSHSNAGIGQSIVFGSEQSIYRSQMFNISLDVFLIAICLFAGIYHTIIFIFRKEEKELLFFGLFCFSLALRTFSTGSTLMMQALPGLSFLVGSRIATTVIPMSAITFLVFSFYFFKEFAPRKIFVILLALNSAFLVLVLTTIPLVYSTIYSYYLLIILATCIFVIGVDIYAIIKRKDFSFIFFLGFLILFAGIANDMMHYLQIIFTGYYLSAFFAGFILIESLILSVKFSQEHLMVSELSERLEIAINTANIDPLTGIYNRRFLVLSGTRELELSKRYDYQFSIVMIDIDYFKKINDNYGHDIGDLVIIKLADNISSNIRGSDILTRFGGDEFVILLPQTNTKEAILVAEKIRAVVEKSTIPINEDVNIQFTISMGVAVSGNDNKSFEEIMRQADEMLYESKKKGRNAVSY